MALLTSKDSVIRTRIAAADAIAAKRVAARAGLTLSDWLRGLVTAALRSPVDSTAPTEAQKDGSDVATR